MLQAGLEFVVHAADVDESVRVGEGVAAYVERLALHKALVVWEARSGGDEVPDGSLLVLGADTSVVCEYAGGEVAGDLGGQRGGDLILGKPLDGADAARMLRMLSGRSHTVLTGVAVVGARRTLSAVERTVVTFGEISEAEIAKYVASREPLDKAGAYGIQGYAARWIPRVEGCYFNVMGLPIARVVKMLAEAG